MIEAFVELISYINQMRTLIMYDLSLATRFEHWHFFVDASL